MVEELERRRWRRRLGGGGREGDGRKVAPLRGEGVLAKVIRDLGVREGRRSGVITEDGKGICAGKDG